MIKQNVKVQLKKQYIDSKSGNVFWVGEYYLSQLPEKIRDNIDYVDNVYKVIERTLLDKKEKTFTEKVETKENNDLVNINKCSFEDLINIKGIGESTAKKIIELRSYESIEDFKEKFPILIEKIKNKISI